MAVHQLEKDTYILTTNKTNKKSKERLQTLRLLHAGALVDVLADVERLNVVESFTVIKERAAAGARVRLWW
jgi:hypothetical protein